MSEERGSISVREAGARGGQKNKERYAGTDHFQQIGKRGGATTAGRYGADHYQEIGKKGGATTAERYGEAHYQQIGRKGGARVRALIAQAKAQEETRDE